MNKAAQGEKLHFALGSLQHPLAAMPILSLLFSKGKHDRSGGEAFCKEIVRVVYSRSRRSSSLAPHDRRTTAILSTGAETSAVTAFIFNLLFNLYGAMWWTNIHQIPQCVGYISLKQGYFPQAGTGLAFYLQKTHLAASLQAQLVTSDFITRVFRCSSMIYHQL